MKCLSLAALIMLCASGFARAESKHLTLGDITKIDTKNKSITVSDAISYEIAELGDLGSTRSPRGGGGGGGGGGVSARGGGGRRGRSGGAPGGVRGASAPIPMEFKVMVSSKTVIKDGENEIKFEDLKVGDRLQVFSAKGGTKVDATEIIRSPKDQ
jgi:hypothetical protein